MAAWPDVLIGAALKGTVLMGAAWVVASALRRRSAAGRHLVWTAAAAGLLALPLLSISMPTLAVRTSALAPLVSGATFHASAVDDARSAVPSAVVSAATSQPAPASAPIDWRFLVTLFWAAGTLLSVAHMTAAWVIMARRRRRSRPFADASPIATLSRAFGIRRAVALLELPEGSMPLSFGVWHPAVFLPAGAREWDEDRRRVVLLHELAHIRRHDLATQLMARAAVSLFWWNPLAWILWREFVKERERAADDLVLAAGEPATAYATQLLEIARSLQAVPALVSAAVAMARPSQLEGRLMAILDTHIDRRSLSPRAPLAAAALTVALVAPFAALQAQDKPDPVIQPNIEVTIHDAIAQQNHQILDNAAAAYADARKYDAARQLLESSLAIRAKASGDRSAAYAIGLMKLGDLSVRRGKTADAVDFYTRAVALGDTPDTVPGLIYLATDSLARKDAQGAETLIDRALAVSATGGEAGRALTVKGNIALANGLSGVAELDYQQALAQDAPGSPEAALTMETYARLLKDQGRSGEADAMLAQAKPIRQERVAAIVSHIRSLRSGAVSDAIASKVGAGVRAPTLLSKTEPEYSEEARAAKYQGTAVLSVVIGINGQATDMKLVRSLGFGLDEKAAEAVSQWRFNPGQKDGVPVTVQATIEVNFRLL